MIHSDHHHAHEHPHSSHSHPVDTHPGTLPGGGDFNKHASHTTGMFRDAFFICLLLSVPALVWEPMLQDWFGYRAPTFNGSDYIPALFGTVVYLYGGRIFLQSAWRELRARQPGMMTLISLAISVAFFYSIFVTAGFAGHALWWELATLVTIMLLGHWIEMRSVTQAQGALKELAKLLPDMAIKIVDDDQYIEVPVRQLQERDRILIRPGASIAADGIILSGNSSVNESMITGESRLIEKHQGDTVIAGTVNGEGSLRVSITGTGDKTALAGIMRLVEQAKNSRSRAQALADRAAYFLTLIAVITATLTLLIWQALGASLDFTITRMVAVLVIACPHALGLAVPLVIAISTTMGARNGLLVRDRRGLEEARTIDIVVFDKTGTLTLGEQRVIETVTSSSVSQNDALRIAAAIERDSEHPIAIALRKSADELQVVVPHAEDFMSIPGHGVQATIDGYIYRVGGPALITQYKVVLSDAITQAALRYNANGLSAIYLTDNETALAVFAIADMVRPESKEAVRLLHENGLEVAMLTGDSHAVAERVAGELGIDTFFAQVLPEDKAHKIQELQSQGKRVAMVGDGVNDAPALIMADIGIAIGAGTDVAVESGDVVLVRSDPRDVSRIVRLSKATYRKMVQNIGWAAGYNVIAIPLAAGVLAGVDVLLPPAVGAVLMSLSTVIVAMNAQLLRRVEI